MKFTGKNLTLFVKLFYTKASFLIDKILKVLSIQRIIIERRVNKHLNELPAFLKNGEGVVIISHDASKTGAPFVALNIAKTLACNFKKKVVTVLIQGGPLENQFKECGIVINLSHVSLNSIEIKEKALADRVFRALADLGVSKCICNTVLGGMLMSFIEKNNFSCINLIHEQSESIKKNNYVEATNNILDYSNKIVFSSNFVRKDFEDNFRKTKSEIYVRPQGIFLNNLFRDKKEEASILLRKKLRIENTARIILGCGTGSLRKGVDIFFEIASRISCDTKSGKCYFLWLGEWEPKLKIELLKRAKDLGFFHKLILIDFENDPSVFFAGADVFLLPSRQDPFPSVVLNAMDAGTPVIAFDKGGGAPEILVNQQGIIVSYLDVFAMGKELSNLLNNKNTYNNISIKSKKAVETDFNFESYVQFLLTKI